MTDLVVRVSEDLRPIVQLGVLALENVRVVEDDRALDDALVEAAARLRQAPPPERLAVRAMYRRTGLDPTRRRPSSEALLRRVCRGEALPRINTMVDVCNWCSVELQMPYGLYDLDRIEGAIDLRRGGPGEEYAGIRKDVVHLEGRMTLADRLGPFGNPSSDSARTMVTTATTRALAVIFAPREIALSLLSGVLDLTLSRATGFAGGQVAARLIV
jgi:DNA/RNA-binding domain of Phe-tRNA-synthetase-like protein